MSNETCVVLVPVAKSIEDETEQGLQHLANKGYVVRYLRGSSQIDLARATLVTKALSDGFKETFWIDSDIDFQPEWIDQIRAHNKPFVAGLYVRKGGSGFAGKFLPGSKDIVFGKGGQLLEVEHVGMGFTYIRSEVYERIRTDLSLPTCGGGYEGQEFVPYFLPLIAPNSVTNSPEYLSEDSSFCYRAAQVGYRPVIDTTIKLGHIGKYKWSWDDLLPKQTIETLTINFS